MSQIIVELTEDERSLLTLALGTAMGVACRDGNGKLGRALLRLANSVHKNNPAWTPYAVDEEVTS
jgi:hypothetical protein